MNLIKGENKTKKDSIWVIKSNNPARITGMKHIRPPIPQLLSMRADIWADSLPEAKEGKNLYKVKVFDTRIFHVLLNIPWKVKLNRASETVYVVDVHQIL